MIYSKAEIWKHCFVNYGYGIFKTRQEFPCPCSRHSASPTPSSLPSADQQIAVLTLIRSLLWCSHGLEQTWKRHFMSLNVVSAWLLSRQSQCPHLLLRLPLHPPGSRQDLAQYILSLTTPDLSTKGTRKSRFC